VTHFGVHDDAGEHLAALRAHLDEVEGWADELDEAGFVAKLRERAQAPRRDGSGSSYAQALPPEQSYQGLRRYLRRRDQAG
jgi:hypothetical protein